MARWLTEAALLLRQAKSTAEVLVEGAVLARNGRISGRFPLIFAVLGLILQALK